MNKSKLSMAQQIAQAAIAFEQRRTGNHGPKSVTVVLSEGTLVHIDEVVPVGQGSVEVRVPI